MPLDQTLPSGLADLWSPLREPAENEVGFIGLVYCSLRITGTI